jgi:phosphoserine phosphatase RsbU/P
MGRGKGKPSRLREFFRSYTEGLSADQVRRLFDHDAADAYAVLTRDQPHGETPKTRLRRLVFQARILFLGLSYKLSPPRRLLFGAAMIGAFLGFFARVEIRTQNASVSIDFSPFWFLVSIGCLVFLLALELVDRIRVRDELEVARELQTALLPHSAPAVPGYAIAHSYRTANEVGGDYYDLRPLPDGRLVLVVGDASGHGMAAGLVMAIANATLRTALDLDPAPPRVIELVNRALCRTGDRRTFMSLFYGLLEPESGHLEHVNAGHPFPLLRRAGGEVKEIGDGSLPLGLRDPLDLAPSTVELAPGDLLLLFSDGLFEAIGPDGEAFGYARLHDLLAEPGSAQEVHDRVLAAFDAHLRGEPLRDDLTVVVVSRVATEAEEPR